MTDQERKAMQMALNALEFNLPVIEDFGSKEQLTDCHRAIMALYKTLTQPEQTVANQSDCGHKEYRPFCQMCMATKQKPEQEPVTWRNAAIRLGEDLYSVGPDGYYDMTAEQWLDWALSVVTVPPSKPEQEPVAYMTYKGYLYHASDPKVLEHSDPTPLYAAPPKREWVSLTDDDLAECFVRKGRGLDKNEKFARLIEAALRSKNT